MAWEEGKEGHLAASQLVVDAVHPGRHHRHQPCRRLRVCPRRSEPLVRRRRTLRALCERLATRGGGLLARVLRSLEALFRRVELLPISTMGHDGTQGGG